MALVKGLNEAIGDLSFQITDVYKVRRMEAGEWDHLCGGLLHMSP